MGQTGKPQKAIDTCKQRIAFRASQRKPFRRQGGPLITRCVDRFSSTFHSETETFLFRIANFRKLLRRFREMV